MSILEELEWRGLLADCTDLPALTRRLAEGPITLYCGFDPTADSLHIGNLVPLLALRRFQLHGHRPIVLAGGATGMVGDPSGKSAERNLQTPEMIAGNIAGQRQQLEKFLDFGPGPNSARLVNNADWTAQVTFLEFLRDIGKHFTVNHMVAKESVRSRMDDREAGISFTEFSYMLLQAFDFLHLRQTHQCELQVGATDQWGNITAGTDLCRKKIGATTWGLTFPLLTKSDGTKYGKTAGGSVWLDPRKTPPYRFYQFFMQADDTDVIKLLKTLTLLPRERIESLAEAVRTNASGREAQKVLAAEMTTLVHGASAAVDARRASEILFGGGLEGVSETTFREVAGEVPTKPADRAKLAAGATPIVEWIVEAGLAPSKGQARKDVEGGGIYLNNERITAPTHLVLPDLLLFDRYLLLRKGKRTYALLDFG